jgi:hypothetical protein
MTDNAENEAKICSSLLQPIITYLPDLNIMVLILFGNVRKAPGNSGL